MPCPGVPPPVSRVLGSRLPYPVSRSPASRMPCPGVPPPVCRVLGSRLPYPVSWGPVPRMPCPGVPPPGQIGVRCRLGSPLAQCGCGRRPGCSCLPSELQRRAAGTGSTRCRLAAMAAHPDLTDAHTASHRGQSHVRTAAQVSHVQVLTDSASVGSFFIVRFYTFPDNLGGSACSSEIVQTISAVRHFGGRLGMIRRAVCRNWLHFTQLHADCP